MIESMRRKVLGYSNLYKDMNTGVIQNCEGIERQRYLSAKQQALMNLSAQTEIAHLKNEIASLKEVVTEINEIKRYLNTNHGS